MFARVGRSGVQNEVGPRAWIGGARCVNQRHAVCLEPTGGMHRHAVETDKVRRSDQNGDVETAAGKQPIGVRGHRARIHQTGMRRDERDQIAGHLARDRGQVFVNGRRQRRCRSGIPRARHGGGTQRFRYSAIHAPEPPATSHEPPTEPMLAFAMPAPLTRAQVQAVGALANLELDAAEVELFPKQLGAILASAGELQQVDTSGVPPTAYGVAGRNADRPDQIAPSLDKDDVFRNAPESDRASNMTNGGGFFKVPRVI